MAMNRVYYQNSFQQKEIIPSLANDWNTYDLALVGSQDNACQKKGNCYLTNVQW